MEFGKDLLEKAKNVKGVEELLEWAEKNNISLKKEDAEKAIEAAKGVDFVKNNETLKKAADGLSGLLGK